MKIPCVCSTGFHSFTANEMVDIIGAFQRGELHKTRLGNGVSGSVIIPLCIAEAEFFDSKSSKFTGPCNVELENGTQCKNPRGHRDGRHGHKTRATREANPATQQKAA